MFDRSPRPMIAEVACSLCGREDHTTAHCRPEEREELVQVNAVGNWAIHQPKRDPFTPSYNPGWREHPFFKWEDPNQPPPPPMNHPPPPNPHQAGRNHAYKPPHQRGYQGQGHGGNQHNNVHQQPPRPHKSLEEMIGELINSQQFIQNNMQTNNDVVHKLQDAQRDQKVSLDQLTRQMTQLATSINDLRGNGGGILAPVQNPRRENLNHITLRSG